MAERVRFLVKAAISVGDGLTLPSGRHPGFRHTPVYQGLDGPDPAASEYWIDASAEECVLMGGDPNSAGAKIYLTRHVRQGAIEVIED